MSRPAERSNIEPMSRSDIDDTVRDMWSTRPHRRRDDRKIAGVAAAIGRRYRIDPILVRVAFVVTTIFGGVGIMLYLLGWLLLPEEGDEVSGAEALIGHGRSSMSKPLTIVLAIALIPASSGLFTAHVSALFSAAAVAAALYLLHKNRGPLGAPVTVGAATGLADPTVAYPGGIAGGTTSGFAGGMAGGTTSGAPGGTAGDTLGGFAGSTAGGTLSGTTSGAAHGTAGGPTGGMAGDTLGGTGGGAAHGTAGGSGAGTADGASPDTDPSRSTPPAWDPLGVAPFAWDLPEPAPASQPPAEPPPKRHRSAVTPVTLGLALMIGGAAAIVAMTSATIGAAEVAAVTLAVIGAGLVVGSFVRGGRGLIAVAIPLGLATYMMSVVPVDHFGPHGMGDRNWQAKSMAEVQPLYRHTAGDATLDLSQLTLAGTDTVLTTVQLGAGDLTVVLPPNADVEVYCEAGVGDITCLDDSQNGRNPRLDKLDLGPDGVGGGKIVLNASVGAGDLQVSRHE